ncbi:MAG: acetolactate synthase large subunit, acetolactate synthase I/II/III large subunit [Candidatus Peregrinibacteria bacterium GW2011_GWE2_39_6]|nr:MAG: acetolactate synthase large subunit, acetolactate synthase I/II/III large subunit [Candidatus Peregrinibacteria bacterium GW2011_GWF2_39_17]KKR25850.1 MAG: acetolactate synthase large subunit, acetolactate synthase I/II/III large subunit [Candidatus Peregrinibacteria bacterium GW2011_GWE2_39_6]HCW32325.1 biosynthetic-type acetolactate synthase large subunit [Candidatus Peregrinibacteria bacterium]
MREYTVADAILDTLKAHGITTIFGYPGGAILPFYDALPSHQEIQHVLVRNEQGAAFAAQGWARSTRQIGVCCATSGPGGTNFVTGIADAYLDSIPLLCITGQVPLSMIGKDMFQEVDMTGITLNITKHNYLVENSEDIVRIVTEAIHIATSGRPGPVHIDVPKNIMAATHPRHFKIPKVNFSEIDPTLKAYQPNSEMMLSEVIDLLNQAKNPVLLLGHGIKLAQAESLANDLVMTLRIPTTTTILGKGIMASNNQCYLGMLGMHGFYASNLAVHNADLILNIGSRFDDRIVGRYDAFSQKAKIIHVDIDASELGKVVTPDLPIHSDAKIFLKQLLTHSKIKPLAISDWWEQIRQWQKNHPYQIQTADFTIRTCLEAINDLIAKEPASYILVTDVGQHQMWAALSCNVPSTWQWLSSGGSGTMGFGLPAAIGAAFAHKDKTIICLSGDGGIQMNIQELGTLAQYNLNVKVCILNNGYLGMVRQWQELFYERNYSAVEIPSPNYQKIAEAYGLKGSKITTKEILDQQLPALFTKKAPQIIEFKVKKEDNVFPMVPGGKTLGETIME